MGQVQALYTLLSQRCEDVAVQWQQSLAHTGFVASSVPEVQAHLSILARRTIHAVLADEPDRNECRTIGAAVASLHYVHPDALERTLNILAGALLAGLPTTDRLFLQQRVDSCLAALATGFIAEVCTIMLREQDAIRNAVLSERDRAYDELRAILDAAVDAMVLISPERTALMINRSFTEVFGIKAPEIVGKSFEELRPLVEPLYANPQDLGRLIMRVAGSAGDATQDLIQVKPKARILQLHSVPVQRSDGVLLGRLHIFRDVTRERELDRREREFLAEVSHEFRTPLTSIKGYANLLLTESTTLAEQREFLEIIQNNAQRMTTFVNDLVDLSRLELGKLDLRPNWVDLPVVLERIAASVRPRFAAKQQGFSVSIPETLPRVWGDADRLAQVFSNLLANANNYTPVGGRITLVAETGAGVVHVTVADTGIGMSAEEQALLFTKFYRIRKKDTSPVQGSGLGLAITRSLVELHRGTIAVHSKPGVGSTFTVALPVQPPKEPEPAR
ncbi:MAG: ATP-binding protein [Chloroflexi bacterium]|nr:ATP-binding protein [Chloroflexota bacterium]